jgi:hypothetical protein
LNVHRVCNARQIKIQTAEPLVPDPNLFEVETAIEMLRNCKPPGSDQILAKLIEAGGKTLWSEIHKLISSIWNKEVEEVFIVLIYKKADKTDCSNYCGISLLSTSYKILSNILLSRLSPYVEEITGEHQCVF